MKNHRYFYSVLVALIVVFSMGVVHSSPLVSGYTKLFADDAFKNSGFGWAVAIDGDTAVVSAFADYDNKGAAYIFERTASGWQQISKLTASDGMEGDYLGLSAAISGDTIVLGTALDDNAGGEDSGAVYIFVKPDSGWPAATTEEFKLVVPGDRAGRGFGAALALKNGTLVVGAPGKDSTSVPGEVFVYEGSGVSWDLKATLNVASLNGGDAYGSTLGFDGNTIAVGAFGKDSWKGALYVYHKPADGWSNKSYDALLIAGDAAKSDFFGGAVSVDGDTILVGANGDDDDGSKSGSAYVFVRSDGEWTQQDKLTAADAQPVDNFGYAVQLAGDTAVIGASHTGDDASDSVYLFRRSGTIWTELDKISDPDNKDGSKFGTAVAIDASETVVLAGAFGADVGSERSKKDAGAAYLFELADPVDLVLVKKDDVDPALVGENITYSLLVTNNSSDIDATNVTITDTLPAGLSYVSDKGGCNVSGQIVSCVLGTIVKDGGTGSVEITVRADSAGSVTNTATVNANEVDANPGDNTDSEDTTIKTKNDSGQGGGGGGGGAINIWLLLLFAGFFQRAAMGRRLSRRVR